MAVTGKQAAFIDEYLRDFNATRAAERAGYKGDNNTLAVTGHENLRNPKIAEIVSRRLSESAMSPSEVIMRLAEHARGDIADFLQVSRNGDAELVLMGENDKARTRLIKKVTQRKTIRTTEKSQTEEIVLSVELHDAQAALVAIGKHHGLFKDMSEIDVRVKNVSQLSDDELRAIVEAKGGGGA